jgi:3-hydroxyacyl-[acyl-carrier-protein] dehydratase
MNTLKQEIFKSELEFPNAAQSDTVVKRYCFHPDFIGFSGHFPGYPILPALVQLQIGIILAEENEGRPLKISSIERAKFLLEIHPNKEVLAQCKRRLLKGKLGADVRIMLENNLASSLLFTFRGLE